MMTFVFLLSNEEVLRSLIKIALVKLLTPADMSKISYAIIINQISFCFMIQSLTVKSSIMFPWGCVSCNVLVSFTLKEGMGLEVQKVRMP